MKRLKKVLAVDLDRPGAAFCMVRIVGGSPSDRIVPESLFLPSGISEGLLLRRRGVESDRDEHKPEPQ
ncbi:hypothetical protein [Paenibacillus sp. MDMC362]|uniref:hypothetical protein n=1 Tax=Paenibacillus sp. MDMC362 TaxID=2977365 RepID=UPI0011BDA7C3|nr:hypothetical protein [Paenibacillus sp. MDMC362]